MTLLSVLRRLTLCALLVGLACPPARAADSPASYPNRPVKFVVGFAPGGNTDIYARLLAAHLQKVWGTQFIVENKPGATSILAIQSVVTSKPDGYTMCFCVTNTATNRFTHTNLPYKMEDLIPVGLVFNSSTAMVVPASSEFESAQKLIAYGRANPRKLSYATTGPGGGAHLVTELFRGESGVIAEAVHYKGAAPASIAVLSGEVNFYMSATATVMPHLQAKKLRALAVNTPDRLVALPGVPTIGEVGFPAVASSTWYGVLAPAATPREIVQMLNREINAFAQSKAIIDKTTADGDRARGDLSPEAFAKYINEDTEVMRKVIEPLKIRLD